MTQHVNEEKLNAYLDRELEPQEALEITEHLKACHHCNSLYQDLLRVRMDIQDYYRNMPASADLESRILSSIRQETNVKGLLLPFISIVACVLLTVVILLVPIHKLLVHVVMLIFRATWTLISGAGVIVWSIPHLFSSLMLTAVSLLIISGFSLLRLLHTQANEEVYHES